MDRNEKIKCTLKEIATEAFHWILVDSFRINRELIFLNPIKIELNFTESENQLLAHSEPVLILEDMFVLKLQIPKGMFDKLLLIDSPKKIFNRTSGDEKRSFLRDIQLDIEVVSYSPMYKRTFR